jgi:hypothetical protein
VYLYPSAAAAQTGEGAGGSGFLVSIDSAHAGYHHIYAVTNSHVIREASSPVIRLNTRNGVRIEALEQDAWIHHPDGDDIAVASVQGSPDDAAKIIGLTVEGFETFVTPEFIAKYNVGPGDDVFMVGRFVNHEGRQKNAPSIRFGTIAQMDEEPIRHDRGHLQESFLVEVHSLPGYSGAPVFIRIPPLSVAAREGVAHFGVMTMTRLLGVDWCHLRQDWPVLDRSDRRVVDDDDVPLGYHVRANTGMAGVVPAWKLQELLFVDELVAMRQRDDAELAQTPKQSPKPGRS